MEFTVCRASNWMEEGERITINTVEELQELDKRYGNYGIIIRFNIKQIWIYDDYIE